MNSRKRLPGKVEVYNNPPNKQAATVTHFQLAMSYCETETKVSPMQETFAEKGKDKISYAIQKAKKCFSQCGKTVIPILG